MVSLELKSLEVSQMKVFKVIKSQNEEDAEDEEEEMAHEDSMFMAMGNVQLDQWKKNITNFIGNYSFNLNKLATDLPK